MRRLFLPSIALGFLALQILTAVRQPAEAHTATPTLVTTLTRDAADHNNTKPADFDRAEHLLESPRGPLSAAQQQQMRVSPAWINVRLDPGKKYDYEITIDNLTKNPLPIKLSFDSLDAEDETGDARFGTSSSPLVAWSEVSPDSLILDALGRRTVKVTVKIPETVRLGGYYGVLFIEPLTRSGEYGAQVSGKVGVLMLANVSVGDTERKAEVVTWRADKLFVIKQNANFSLRVRNRGLNHFTAIPRVLLQPWFGDPRVVALQERIVFPGKSRTWHTAVNMAEFPYGVYTAVAMVSVGNGEMVQASTTLVSLPILPAVLGLLGISLSILIYKKARKYRKSMKSL